MTNLNKSRGTIYCAPTNIVPYCLWQGFDIVCCACRVERERDLKWITCTRSTSNCPLLHPDSIVRLLQDFDLRICSYGLIATHSLCRSSHSLPCIVTKNIVAETTGWRFARYR